MREGQDGGSHRAQGSPELSRTEQNRTLRRRSISVLTVGRKRGSVAALAVLLLAPVALAGGTAMVPVQAQTLDGGAAVIPCVTIPAAL